MNTNVHIYKRPGVKYQDSLTEEEIQEKLIGYKKVKDINTIDVGTDIRYLTYF